MRAWEDLVKQNALAEEAAIVAERRAAWVQSTTVIVRTPTTQDTHACYAGYWRSFAMKVGAKIWTRCPPKIGRLS